MNPEQRLPHGPTPPPSLDAEPAKPKIDLSLTQVLGGALAAMTAAFLGSRLSVAGTVIGAALASIVAAVGGSLYTASLRTTRERVRTVWQGRVGGSALPATVESTGNRNPRTTAEAPAQPSAPQPATAAARVSWRTVLVAAFAAFALAAVVLTGIELATGSALSGGSGTTVSQVTEPQPATPADDASPSAPPSSAAPSATATPTPSSTSSVTAEPVPTPSATATEQPTTSPSSASPTTSATPEAAPSSATPSPQG